jgi:hypothetical protein
MQQMFRFDFFAGKFSLQNDFIFICSLAVLFSFFTLSPRTERLQDRLYGEKFTTAGRWLAVVGSVVLFYLSLSFISSLDFNPFIYFRF